MSVNTHFKEAKIHVPPQPQKMCLRLLDMKATHMTEEFVSKNVVSYFALIFCASAFPISSEAYLGGEPATKCNVKKQ